MASGNMKDIKRRIKSVQSTMQITKAMELVASSKMRHAKERALGARPYFNALYQTITHLAGATRGSESVYTRPREVKNSLYIVIAGDRGLAGGYNANVVRLVTGSGLKPEDVRIFAVGRKGRDALARKGYEIAADHSDVINEPLYSDAMEITRELLSLFEKQEIGEIYLAYTSFKNTVSQIPRFMKLLPVDTEAAELKGDAGGEGLKPDLLLMNYEPDETEVLDAIIPKYVSSLIYGAFLEAVASENGARMTAMDSATNNAEEMIEKLSLQYNRARQGSITQELTEIIAGADA